VSSWSTRCASSATCAWSRKPPSRAESSGVAARAHTRTPPRDLARFLPSGRSLAIAFGLVCAAAGAYLLARETLVFAVRTIEVRGAPSGVAARVRHALQPFAGKSLVSLDGSALVRRADALPVVVSAAYDRDFPHTLRVFVIPEEPALVARRGPEAWLVSARGRVMTKVSRRAFPHLARLWVPRATAVSPGTFVEGAPAQAMKAILPIRHTRFARQIATVRPLPEDLTIVLRSNLKLRLGPAVDLPLKLAVAEALVAKVGHVAGYADLSVPGRPVVALKSQPGG
jgi:cell division septal protein FtsQ